MNLNRMSHRYLFPFLFTLIAPTAGWGQANYTRVHNRMLDEAKMLLAVEDHVEAAKIYRRLESEGRLTRPRHWRVRQRLRGMTAVLARSGFQPTPGHRTAEGKSYPRQLWITLWKERGKPPCGDARRGRHRNAQ